MVAGQLLDRNCMGEGRCKKVAQLMAVRKQNVKGEPRDKNRPFQVVPLVARIF